MASYNDLTIIGNVGVDAEMQYTPGGKAVTTFSIAVSEQRGGKGKVTEWFRVRTWEKLAEACNQYVRKGMAVLVQGRVYLHRWEGKSGERMASLEVDASRVVFLSGGNQNGQDSGEGEGSGDPDSASDIPEIV